MDQQSTQKSDFGKKVEIKNGWRMQLLSIFLCFTLCFVYLVLTIQTTEAEREFRCMKIVKTRERSRLSQERLEQLTTAYSHK
jgi:hypothetical protein